MKRFSAVLVKRRFRSDCVILFSLLSLASSTFFAGCSRRPITKNDFKLQSTEEISKLYLLKVFNDYVITEEQDGMKGTFIVPCDALLAIDFKGVDISRDGDKYVVELPRITVEEPRVDRNGLKTYEVTKGLHFMKSSDPLRQNALSRAKSQMCQEAISEHYLSCAKEQATNIVSSLIRQGDRREAPIVFKWLEDNASSNPD